MAVDVATVNDEPAGIQVSRAAFVANGIAERGRIEERLMKSAEGRRYYHDGGSPDAVVIAWDPFRQLASLRMFVLAGWEGPCCCEIYDVPDRVRRSFGDAD